MISLLIHIIVAHILSYLLLNYSNYAMVPLNYTIVLAGCYIALWLISAIYDRAHFRKVPVLIRFILYFFKELIVANIKIAMDAITPVHYMTPAVIAFPMNARTDLEITLLANLISLTPGTLSIDISEDKKTLYVHTIYMDEGADQLKEKIKSGFEDNILKLTR